MRSQDGAARRTVMVDALAVGAATGTYGVSFGALSIAAGLSLPETMALSLLTFTGASQFAFVGLAGSATAAVTTAVLLGARNAFYAVSLAKLLHARGLRRWASAQLVIDESTAMAIGQPTPALGRLAFYATGVAVFVFWNLATVVGALGARVMSDPRVLGIDAAAPAAFLALLAPRLRGREPWAVALAGAIVAVALSSFVPAGVPVLAAAAVALAFVVARPGRSAAESSGSGTGSHPPAAPSARHGCAGDGR